MVRKLGVLAALILAWLVMLGVSMWDITNHYTGRGNEWIRQIDAAPTAETRVGDTTTAPSVWIENGRHVRCRIRANMGSCSTVVWQVSNNDTNWTSVTTAPLARTVSQSQHFLETDSLNRGGITTDLFPVDSTRTLNPVRPFAWRFARVILTSNINGDGPPGNASGFHRLDSLRISYEVIR